MTICLNMIVKNESEVILRCLKSVKKIIDYWVIVDTGSTDGTQKMIREFLGDIPGELYERPWVDFSFNRNEALQFAKEKGDYLLIIDADDLLIFSNDFKKPHLIKDFYIAIQQDQNKEIDTQWILLIKNSLHWRWHGVTHEVLECPEMKNSEILLGVTNFYLQDGARSKDPLKYEKDAALLERALEKEPTNTRTAFYLAESYRGAKEYLKAIVSYQNRVSLGGSEEEVFWSLYCIGTLQEAIGLDPTASLEKAYQYRPSRIEPLYSLAQNSFQKGDFKMAYQVAEMGRGVPLSQDAVFVCRWMYEWGLLFLQALAAYHLGLKEEFNSLSKKLLDIPTLPSAFRKIG